MNNLKVRNITNLEKIKLANKSVEALKREIEELKSRNDEIKKLPRSEELKNEEERNIVEIKNKTQNIIKTLDDAHFYRGTGAVVELIKQKVLVLSKELWWDVNYGIELYSLDEVRVSFWMREVINGIKYIKGIRYLEITKKDNVFIINVAVVLYNNEELKSKFNITF